MEKAYDPQALVEGLKGKGIVLAEEAAEIVVGDVFDWIHQSAVLSPNPYDDMLDAAVMPKVKEMVLAKLQALKPQT
jgi:hypothetical protein